MSSILSAVGTANPYHRFKQDQILQFMTNAHQLNDVDAGRLSKLYGLSGIEERYSVLPDFSAQPGDYTFFGNEAFLTPFPTTAKRAAVYEQHARQVGADAFRDLLSQLPGFERSAITHLITVSCTGMYAPGLDIDLVLDLGLEKSVERTCINFMGCYGAFNALKMADYICRAQTTAKVLIVDVELCTLHFQRESTLENWVSNSLFGDGGAAVLVEHVANRSARSGLVLKSFYSELITDAKNMMGWRIGDTGFEMKLSSQIAKNIGNHVMDVTQKLLAKAGLTLGQISSLAVHPGGRRILEVCDEAFENRFCLKHSFNVLHDYGNMSSATILFVLKRFLNSETIANQNLMSYAFGPGLTFESMIVETY